jgi:hypothetical protein
VDVHPAPTLLLDVASRVDHSWPQVVGQRQITALMSAIASALRSSGGPRRATAIDGPENRLKAIDRLSPTPT